MKTNPGSNKLKRLGGTLLDRLAPLLARFLRRYAERPVYEKYFRLWEQHGFHITPANYYSPIPDTRSLPDSLWTEDSGLLGIDMNDAGQRHLLCDVFGTFSSEYEDFAAKPTDVSSEFHFNNGMFDGIDALTLYCMVRHFQPRRIIEVGSGYSSRVSARAALRNQCTELVCVEPYPDAILRGGMPGLSKLIPKRIQDLDMQFFEQLEPGDFLFIDTSHTVKIGGEVNYLFFNVIPRLKPGVLVHIHDIFFPREYVRAGVLDMFLFWNEQYLLQAFLMFNSDFEVVLCNSYLTVHYEKELQRIFPNSPWWTAGCSFWMRRK
jgi:hypothetical protein